MKLAYFQWGGAASTVALALLVGAPVRAADESGVRPIAEELGQRTKPVAAPEGEQKGGLSDSAVRVMLNYAFSLVPNDRPGPDGKPVKLDKSDPNKFLIPLDDARRVIRAATRSAYAEACELPDLAQANYRALIASEQAKKIWTEQQQLMIKALYLFSAAYFAGNVKIGEADAAAASPGAGADGASKKATPEQDTAMVAPKRPQCPPEQKQKVTAAINAYVQATRVPAPKAGPPAPAPAQPASSGSN